MPDTPDRDLEIDDSLVVPAAELRWRFSRSSGPGGQHVNTTDTRVELSWDVAASGVLDERRRTLLLERLGSHLAGGVLTVAASEFRSQLRNREEARTKLASLVRGAMRARRKRRPTKPTRGSQRRRLDDKRQRGETKQLRRRPDDR
ncbi:alternative ribosome rescue aminoacyl-tRNA hydrolase ArfB [Solicola gregarius]|uniref:Aminoacyl-tRNA hydrolase n=1 Tax=Solicola gregarius TaxID=2908642 RepID=A0AA46TI56_9ACTN|nr:alternative ribosome rescue aminoacyl-tRNA hydrolase ArfB [Solicola gregarius]UYM05299.1 aminoacyl-tRNA hydrolase [Solicola gregarius]